MSHVGRNAFLYRVIVKQECAQWLDVQIQPHLFDRLDAIHMGALGQQTYADEFLQKLQKFW